MLKINRNPSRRELLWFGLMMWPFFLFVGALLYFKGGAAGAAWTVWAGSTLLVAAYYLLAPLRRPFYVGWMVLVFPLGWVISHLVLVLVYYACVTPIGLMLRLAGRDSMQRRRDPGATSYWEPHEAEPPASRYFRQF